MQLVINKDKYTRARGGSAKLYKIFCISKLVFII